MLVKLTAQRAQAHHIRLSTGEGSPQVALRQQELQEPRRQLHASLAQRSNQGEVRRVADQQDTDKDSKAVDRKRSQHVSKVHIDGRVERDNSDQLRQAFRT